MCGRFESSGRAGRRFSKLANFQRERADGGNPAASASIEEEESTIVEGKKGKVMKRSVVRRPTIGWQRSGSGTSARKVIAYRGDLSGSGLRVHYGFDEWQEPIREVRLESIEPGLSVAELPDLAEHVAI